MSTQFQVGPYDDPSPNTFRLFPALPSWLARRVIEPGEEVTWVRGPRLNPWWEAYVTHPLLFVAAVALAVLCLLTGRVLAGSWANTPALPAILAVALVMGSIVVLAFFNGYFTRLVVTSQRLLILQGYEVRHRWNIDDLPRYLLRYGRQPGGQMSPSIDLDALQTALGGSSAGFVDANTIRTFGKQLHRIKAREAGRTDPDQTLPG
jgi:hypothetical protein